MKLSKIQVNNYRQLNKVELFFQEDITVLAGPNNSGKTTFISLIKGFLCDSKLKYTHNDIPVNQVTKWQKAIFPVCVKYFLTSSVAEQVIEDIISEISCDGVLKPEYAIEPCEIKVEVTYDQKHDDIRNFAEYIMDLDESQHSFYFIYTFLFNLLSFKKSLLQYYDKINARHLSYSEKEDEQKSNIIKDLLIEVYSNSLVESCFFADSNYENRCKIEISDFKKLFNFKCINAARQLDDTDTDSSKTLSKSIVSLASKDKNWKDTTKALPGSILTNIQDSGVKEKVRQASVETLGSALKSLAQTNGGHIGEIMLEMDVTEDDVSDLIKKITCAKYQLEGHMLNESSQGLGYSNMIYLHMQLEEFKKSMDSLLVNMFFIEEPESHMHPQMQSVFIKYLLAVYNQIGLQGLVTTHSNEMVRVAGLEHLRVIRETQMFKSEIFDLSAFRKSFVIKNKSDQSARNTNPTDISILENFFDWFFEIGFSEIIFADKAVLYEGDSERLYLKKLITLPAYQKLSGQYIAFIQVGGAYAYNYKSLIEFLKIKTLIVTDLDYKKTALSEAEIFASISTNSTINSFYKISTGETVVHEDIDEDEELQDTPSIAALYEWKEKDQNKLCNNLIFVAFQEKEYYARTLEEAMMSKLLSVKVFEEKARSEWKEIKLNYKLKFPLPNNREGEKDSLFSLRDIVDNMSKSKTDFMYSVILNSLGETMLPKYIEEGLMWLIQ